MSNQRLPTRVSNACDRCRRQKQRCDNFRPCSNCAHTNRPCLDGDNAARLRQRHPEMSDDPLLMGSRDPRPTKRARRSDRFDTDASLMDEDGGGAQSPGLLIHHRSTTSASSEHGGHEQAPPELQKSSNRSRPSSSTSQARYPEKLRSQQSIVAEFGESSSAVDVTRKVLQARNYSDTTGRATFAIPGGESNSTPHMPDSFRSIEELIGIDLLPQSLCDALIDSYFLTTHWFSLVVYEPTFRKRYHALSTNRSARQADRPFLLLLLMILIMSCQYNTSMDLSSTRTKYLTIVRQNFMDLLDEDSLEFIQICTLLGSYWLYWGKPKSSFIVLGTAIKAAQAMSLHRSPSRKLPMESIEERKRVWWTIYTWDRFATIVYGRPLGINDRDCDVQMPGVFNEHIVDSYRSETTDVCLSQYQRLLNRVYHIASPLLENVYGIRYSTDSSLLSDMPDMVKQIGAAMQQWRRELPLHLDIDRNKDVGPETTLQVQIHQLQGLSLQLTYENLMIVIHRPLLADWSHRRDIGSRRESLHVDAGNEPDAGARVNKKQNDNNFHLCLQAALKISKIQRSKPNLIKLARKTHLLSFLGMNLFTSSVVMFICALSDVLSDTAQEAKRGISRNLMVLKWLSNYGSLSSQCSMIIEDLVQVIMEKERKEMLCETPDPEEEVETTDNSPRIDADQFSIGHRRAMSDGQGKDACQPGADSQLPLDKTWNPSYGDTATANFGRTMESLQKVLKDASNTRVPQRTDAFEQPSSAAHQFPQEGALWTSLWPDNSTQHGGYIAGDNSLMQDMGQFWLWDMGSNGEDMFSWGANPNEM